MEKQIGGDCHNLPSPAAVQAQLQLCHLPFMLFIPKARSQHGWFSFHFISYVGRQCQLRCLYWCGLSLSLQVLSSDIKNGSLTSLRFLCFSKKYSGKSCDITNTEGS